MDKRPSDHSAADDPPGLSTASPIRFDVPESSEGVRLEYVFLRKAFGERDVDWKFIEQSHFFEGERPFDIIQIALRRNGSLLRVYFDISAFYGAYGIQDVGTED